MHGALEAPPSPELIRILEFRSLHLRLAPPLPRHQIAYVVTAPIRRRPEHKPVSVFHNFHVAAATNIH
jgi:hypothetical protein